MPALKGTVCSYVALVIPMKQNKSVYMYLKLFYLYFKDSVCIVKQPFKTNLDQAF